MVYKKFKQAIVVSSYADGSEIYRGDDLDRASELAEKHGDKCTLYTFMNDDVRGGVKLKVERCYADGTLDSSESLRLNFAEIKHFKTLVRLFKS